MKTVGVHLLALLVVGGSAVSIAGPSARADDGNTSDAAPWVGAIRGMDEALARGDVRAALKAREDARLAALGSWGWEGPILVGDATLRLAQSTGLRHALEPAARRAYVFALFRARRQGSLDGVLRVTEAFAVLGDSDMARKGFVIANGLAVTSREPQALERVRAFEERLKALMPLARGVPAASADPRPGPSLTRGGGDRGSHVGE